MQMIAPDGPERKLVIGVDTHKYLHVAVALDELGGRRGELTVSADRDGYAALEAWAGQLGRPIAFGVEGTGSSAPASPVRCAAAATPSSKSTAAIVAHDERTASPTPSTPKLQREPCSRARPARCPRPPTARPR